MSAITVKPPFFSFVKLTFSRRQENLSGLEEGEAVNVRWEIEAAVFPSCSETYRLIAANVLSQLMFAAVCCHLAAGWRLLSEPSKQSTGPEIATKQLNQNEVLFFPPPLLPSSTASCFESVNLSVRGGAAGSCSAD